MNRIVQKGINVQSVGRILAHKRDLIATLAEENLILEE